MPFLIRPFARFLVPSFITMVAFLMWQLPAHALMPSAEKVAADSSRQTLIAKFGFAQNYAAIYEQLKKSGQLIFLYRDLDFIFEKDTKHCPHLTSPFLKHFTNHTLICSRIVYQLSEHQSFSLLIKSNSSKSGRLLIYNHGHGGLPADNETFAVELVSRSLELGDDILIVSMPFTGLDKPQFNFKIVTWDGPSEINFRMLLDDVSSRHGIFELFDTGNSHFMRFFIDNAVLSALQFRDNYVKINYIGLSGGATTGLYTCSVLSNILDNCFLVAGVMPLNLRGSPKTFGDAEQISASFHKTVNIFEVINSISLSSTKLHLIYNDKDSCCFDASSASLFKQQLNERGITKLNITIRQSVNHDYDVDQLIYMIEK